MNKTLLALGAALTLLPVATPALAQDRQDRAYDRGYQDAQRDSEQRQYQNRGSEQVNSRTRVWRGDDGRYYCRRSNGTTGLIIGAAGGALAGRAIDTRGNRATGTILGAAAGALLGRELERGRSRCR